MARPIAKRRAGLLGRVASPNGGINSLVLASGCCPVRLDLDHSLFSGHESKAADRSVRSTQTNPPGAPPTHALPNYDECSAASPRGEWPSPPFETLEGAPSKLRLGGRFDPRQIIQRANRMAANSLSSTDFSSRSSVTTLTDAQLAQCDNDF